MVDKIFFSITAAQLFLQLSEKEGHSHKCHLNADRMPIRLVFGDRDIYATMQRTLLTIERRHCTPLESPVLASWGFFIV